MYNVILEFDRRWGAATAGFYLSDAKMLLTGHQLGYIVRHDVETKKSNEIFRSPGGRITAFSKMPNGTIVVSSETGGLYIIDMENGGECDEIITPTNSVSFRIWNTATPRNNEVFIGQTYGKLRRVFKTKGNAWDFESLHGHNDSIFGLDASNKLLVSGDWRGRMMLWDIKEEPERIQGFDFLDCIEDIAWFTDRSLALVTSGGILHYFERRSDKSDSPLTHSFSVNLATGQGRSVAFSDDGKTVFAGTTNEIIQFDTSTTLGKRLDINSCVNLSYFKGNLYVTTGSRFLQYEITEIDIPIESISYKHSKVSLIGHTGVGKSTLCSQLTSESPGEESSTFGKKVWTWIIDDGSDIEKRVILHDHGGQSAVMGTFLPFLFDSDIVLFLFKKKDRSTLTKSLKALEELEDTTTKGSKVVFVETFIDDPMDDARAESKMVKLKETNRITDYRKVSPLTGENIPKLRKLVLKLIDWDNAKTMIELESVTQLRSIIDDLRRKKTARISLKKLLKKYEDKFDSSIPQQHLKFLLSNLSNEGVIEYYPDKLDAIIINDKELNWLRTEIPITAEEHGGIISIEELKEEFEDQPKYIDILDDVYRKYGFSIQIGNLRIFPELLDENPLTIPSQIKLAYETDQSNESLIFRPVRNLQFSLIERLSDLNLSCIDAKKREGLFGWRDNGILYYNFSSILDPSEGEKLKVNWTIGGKKLESRTKLRVDFEQVLWDVLGEPLDSRIHTLIRDGESKEIEFKTSLRYDYMKSETNEDLEYEVIRTIAGFLNTKGGNLIIGVNDEKVVIGLKKDYTTLAKGKKNRDGYRIRLTQLIDTFFPSEVLNLIDFEFKVVRGKEVCWIKIQEAKGPVFVKIPESRKKLRKQETKQFFRRTDSGTKRLDIEESTKYIEEKWSERKTD